MLRGVASDAQELLPRMDSLEFRSSHSLAFWGVELAVNLYWVILSRWSGYKGDGEVRTSRLRRVVLELGDDEPLKEEFDVYQSRLKPVFPGPLQFLEMNLETFDLISRLRVLKSEGLDVTVKLKGKTPAHFIFPLSLTHSASFRESQLGSLPLRARQTGTTIYELYASEQGTYG